MIMIVMRTMMMVVMTTMMMVVITILMNIVTIMMTLEMLMRKMRKITGKVIMMKTMTRILILNGMIFRILSLRWGKNLKVIGMMKTLGRLLENSKQNVQQ